MYTITINIKKSKKAMIDISTVKSCISAEASTYMPKGSQLKKEEQANKFLSYNESVLDENSPLDLSVFLPPRLFRDDSSIDSVNSSLRRCFEHRGIKTGAF